VLDILKYDIPNAKHIYDIIEREFRDVQQFPLKLGDLWPGSILVRKTQRDEVGLHQRPLALRVWNRLANRFTRCDALI